jgi:hypothetical protein
MTIPCHGYYLLLTTTIIATHPSQAPCQLLAVIDAAVATLLAAAAAKPETQPPPPAAAAAPPGSFLQACRTHLILLSQLPASQLLQQLHNAADDNPTSAAAAAVGLAGIKALSVPPLRARASDIAQMALQAALPEALLRGYTAVELTDAAELQLAGESSVVVCFVEYPAMLPLADVLCCMYMGLNALAHHDAKP